MTYLFSSADVLSSVESISRERERIAKEKEELMRKLDSNVALSHGISLPQPVSSSSQVILDTYTPISSEATCHQSCLVSNCHCSGIYVVYETFVFQSSSSLLMNCSSFVENIHLIIMMMSIKNHQLTVSQFRVG